MLNFFKITSYYILYLGQEVLSNHIKVDRLRIKNQSAMQSKPKSTFCGGKKSSLFCTSDHACVILL